MATNVAKKAICLALVFLLLNSGTKSSLGQYKNNVTPGTYLTGGTPDWSPDGDKFCTGYQAMSAATAASAASSFGLGAVIMGTILAIYTATIVGTGNEAQNNSSLCLMDSHPLPLNDDQIKSILVQQGNLSPTMSDVTDKYNKICIKYKDEMQWVAAKESVQINGVTWCPYYPTWAANSQDFICAEACSVCTCKATVAGGTLDEPTWEKDSDGNLTLDEKGNPSIQNKDDYLKYFAKHCIMLPVIGEIPLQDFKFNGIIDKDCSTPSMRGVTKARKVLLSGPVWCIYNTFLNFLQQPFIPVSGMTNKDAPMTNEQKAEIQAMSNDYNYTMNAVQAGQGLISKLGTNRSEIFSNDPDFTSFKLQADTIHSGSAFTASTNSTARYGYNQVIPFTIQPNSSNSVNQPIINNTVSSEAIVANNIVNVQNQYIANVMGVPNSANEITMLQSIQGGFSVLAFLGMIFYMFRTGIKVILGTEKMQLTKATQVMIKISILNFAMFGGGLIWAMNKTFAVGFGLAQTILLVGTNQNASVDKCDFTRSWYLPKSGAECTFASVEHGQSPYDVGLDASGNTVMGCLKGPFVNPINYIRPYKPSFYGVYNADGLMTTKYFKLYCINDNDASDEKLAQEAYDPYGNLSELMCEHGYTAEAGYRSSEYEVAGIDISWAGTLSGTKVLETALYTITESGTEVPLFNVGPSMSSSDQLKYITRVKQGQMLEEMTAVENQLHRLYPAVTRFGYERDTTVLSIFDRLDCQIENWLQFNVKDTIGYIDFGAGAAILSGPIVLIIIVFIIIWLVKVISMILHLGQAVLVGTFSVVMLFLTLPICFVVDIFEIPGKEGVAGQNIKRIIGYMSGFSAITFNILLFTSAANYVLYGSPETYITKHMFTSSGHIDGVNCWEDDISSAPIGCLLAKFPTRTKTTTILFISFTTLNGFDIYGYLILRAVLFIVFIEMSKKITTKIHEEFQQIFDAGEGYTLPGSVLNDGGTDVLGSALKKAFTDVTGAIKGGFNKGRGSGGGGK